MASTYILEVPTMLATDWVTRHERYSQLRFRSQEAVAARMSPSDLLAGKDTGIKAPRVIKLKDKRRHRQVRLCEMLNKECTCYKH